MRADPQALAGALTRPLPRRAGLLVCGLCALLLVACERHAPDAAAVPVVPAGTTVGAAPASAADTSVPAADSVLNPAPGASQPGTATLRSNKRMSAAEESSAMPMAGQANDHSAPLATDKRASSP